MKSRIALGVLLFAMSGRVFACWQTEQPPTRISATSLKARITNDDQPLKQVKLALHAAITFDREEARTKGAYDKSAIKSAVSDSNGVLSFGQIPPGRYWLVPFGSHSLGESIAVEVVSPEPKATGRRLWIKYFADSCRDVLVENSD